MPYQVSWELEGYVVSVEFTGTVTVEDIRNTDKDVGELIKAQGNTVHIIVSFQKARQIPLNLFAISKELTNQELPNYGITVLFGLSPVVAAFARSISKVIRTPFYSAPSLSDAMAYLREKDPSLDVSFTDQAE